MRDIKYRQKLRDEYISHKSDGFHYWGYLDEYGSFTSPVGLVQCESKESDQFTVVNDENGVDVYEGDLIVCDSYPFFADAIDNPPTFNQRNYLGEVHYWDQECCFYVGLHVVSNRVRGGACGSALFDYKGCRVIGNIHQNPELLTQDNESS